MMDVGFNERLIPFRWDARIIGASKDKEPSWSR